MECHKTEIYACKCPLETCLACRDYNLEMNRQLGIEGEGVDHKYTCGYCFPAGHRWAIAAIKKGCVNKHLSEHKHKHLFALANGGVCETCGGEDPDLFKVTKAKKVF